MSSSITRVLITGAAGNLGFKLRSHLERSDRCALTLLDWQPGTDPAIIRADISRYDESWVRHFTGQQVVVHLAANPSQWATWEELQGPNVDGLIHVFEAAAACGVERVIYASSSSVMRGYGNVKGPLSADLPMRPINNYQASKAFGERLARRYAEHYGLSVICMRIGLIRQGENRPTGSYFDQRFWLSNRDFCQGMQKAILATDVTFAVLFLSSDNADPLLDLGETRRLLGYRPEDFHRPVQLPVAERVYRFVRSQKFRLTEIVRRLQRST